MTEQAADLVELLFQAFRRLNAEQCRRLLARIDRTSKHGMARAMQGEVQTWLIVWTDGEVPISQRWSAHFSSRSGQFSNVDDIRKRLKQEGYDANAVFVGKSLKAQVRNLIKVARLETNDAAKR